MSTSSLCSFSRFNHRTISVFSALWGKNFPGLICGKNRFPGRMYVILDGYWTDLRKDRPSKILGISRFWLRGPQYQPVFAGRGRIKNAKSTVFPEAWTDGRIKHSCVPPPLSSIVLLTKEVHFVGLLCRSSFVVSVSFFYTQS